MAQQRGEDVLGWRERAVGEELAARDALAGAGFFTARADGAWQGDRAAVTRWAKAAADLVDASRTLADEG